MLGHKLQQRRDCPIPNIISIRREAEKTAAKLQHPVDAVQHCTLIEHVLESADADGQVDRLVGYSLELLGIIHLKGEIGFPRGAPKTRARQFDHARRDVDPDATNDLRSKGEEVMTVAAAEVQDDVTGPWPG